MPDYLELLGAVLVEEGDWDSHHTGVVRGDGIHVADDGKLLTSLHYPP